MLPQVSRWSILVLLLGIAGCAEDGTIDALPSANKHAFNTAQLPTVEFALPDMMCEEGCAAAVEDILAAQPGVEEVRVDFEARSATVAVDEPAFDSQQVIAALVDKGFDNSTLAAEEVATTNGSDVKPRVELDTAPAN